LSRASLIRLISSFWLACHAAQPELSPKQVSSLARAAFLAIAIVTASVSSESLIAARA